MKRKIALVSIFLIAALGVLAQTDKPVEKIRKFYTQTAEKARLAETDAEQGQMGDLVMNELVINKGNHQWRAVGIYQLTYNFFYQGGKSERHLYPDQLVMVKAERKIAARSYREEYLFDNAGYLVFYFQKSENDDQTPAERRVYFAAGKALRIVEDGKTRDRLTAKDNKTALQIASDAAKLKSQFISSIKL